MTCFRFALVASAVAVLLAANSDASAQDDNQPSLQTVTGKVARIIDGDSLRIVSDDDGQDVEVQLEGTDAPEFKQDYGQEATEVLKELIDTDKKIRVTWRTADNYGRILGHVHQDDKHINLEMVRRGASWHYKRYNKEEELAKAEEEARKAKRGLWKKADPVAPWDWRAKNRDSSENTK